LSALARDIRGAAVADFLLVLAVVGLGAALLYPTWSARALRERIADTIADVDALVAAAQSSRQVQGRWPTPAPPGEPPPELSAGSLAELFSRPAYTLGWAAWEVVDSVEAPREEDPQPAPDDLPPASVRPRLQPIVRTVGAVTVHTREEALIAGLLDHYGDGMSFVLDTLWMLVLPERSEATLTR
jgi:hypothetical protein